MNSLQSYMAISPGQWVSGLGFVFSFFLSRSLSPCRQLVKSPFAAIDASFQLGMQMGRIWGWEGSLTTLAVFLAGWGRYGVGFLYFCPHVTLHSVRTGSGADFWRIKTVSCLPLHFLSRWVETGQIIFSLFLALTSTFGWSGQEFHKPATCIPTSDCDMQNIFFIIFLIVPS